MEKQSLECKPASRLLGLGCTRPAGGAARQSAGAVHASPNWTLQLASTM